MQLNFDFGTYYSTETKGWWVSSDWFVDNREANANDIRDERQLDLFDDYLASLDRRKNGTEG